MGEHLNEPPHCDEPGCGTAMAGYDADGQWCDLHGEIRAREAAGPVKPGTRLVEIDALNGEFVATTPDGTRVVLRGVWDSVEVWCQGSRDHFRDDGGCEHADELLATQSVARRLKVIPFGGDAR